MDQPSHIRQRILDEHAELRRQLTALVAAPTVSSTLSFLDMLEAHLAFEESLLEPVLSTVDAWGPVRVQKLRDEHAAQRQELAYIRGHLHAPVGAELAPWLRHFQKRLLHDMEMEEQERLSAELLKDDVVTGGDDS